MSRILALDWETAGLEPGKHAQVSLGVAVMDQGGIIDSAEWVFAPAIDWKGNDRRIYEVRALSVSGYTWKQILAGMEVNQVLKEFSSFVKSNDAKEIPVVAFNASFDLAFFADWLFLCGEYDSRAKMFYHVKPPLIGPWICSKMMAQDRFDQSPDMLDYKLDTVAQRLGFRRSSATHSSLDDCILAGQIYFALKENAVPA